MLRLARKPLGSAFAGEDRRWRKAGRLLAAARDDAVVLQSFDNAVAGWRVRGDARVKRLRAHILSEGDGRLADTSDIVEEAAALLDEAAVRNASLRWPKERAAMINALAKGQSRLRRDWKRACKVEDAEALHRWRKRVKEQIAQLRLIRGMLPKRMAAGIERQKQVAEILGCEHDLFLLAERLKDGPPPADLSGLRDRLLADVTARRSELRRKALSEGKPFAAQSPKDFARIVEDAWAKAARTKGDAGPRRRGKASKSDGGPTSPAT